MASGGTSTLEGDTVMESYEDALPKAENATVTSSGWRRVPSAEIVNEVEEPFLTDTDEGTMREAEPAENELVGVAVLLAAAVGNWVRLAVLLAAAEADGVGLAVLLAAAVADGTGLGVGEGDTDAAGVGVGAQL